ncbi:hypothetical protein IGI04_016737 [Brassica rapa subsp. trilocularis]|uniref:RNase H type-1 domain-containing protein n=1 Tax=Brassica rapa subsp. trilocularis TaxID=1813537 RepID=A0ABQ7MWC7_BRACM|nr:hypothetical protein IGI04_016737 [Brassica rapa subsp. trilocularis]
MERRRPLVLIVESVRVLKLVNLFTVDTAGGSPTFVQLDIAEETVRENEELLREVVVVDDVHLTQVFRDINPTVYIVGITTGEEVNELEMIAAGANTTMVNVVDEVRMTEILQNLPAPAPAPGPKLSTVASKANVYSGPYLSLSLEEERTQICCRLNQIPYPSSSSGLVGLLVEKLCVENFMLYDESDLKLDVFLVQHDMENMYMWVFKERPENALGKMQPMRSYMNGHSKARLAGIQPPPAGFSQTSLLCNDHPSHSTTASTGASLGAWEKPPADVVKCNIGMSWEAPDHISGSSWIVRDCQGQALHHSRQALRGSSSKTESDLRSLLWAVQAMGDLCHKKVYFEASSVEVRESLLNPYRCPSLSSLILRILELLYCFEKWTICHVSDKKNKVAKTIAESVISGSRVQSYVACGSPRWLHQMILEDARCAQELCRMEWWMGSRRSSGTTSRLGACSRGGKGGGVCDNRSGQRSSAIRRGGETNARHDGGLRIDTVKKRPETSCSTSRTDTEYTSSQCRTTTRSGRGMAVMPPELLA